WRRHVSAPGPDDEPGPVHSDRQLPVLTISRFDWPEPKQVVPARVAGDLRHGRIEEVRVADDEAAGVVGETVDGIGTAVPLAEQPGERIRRARTLASKAIVHPRAIQPT